MARIPPGARAVVVDNGSTDGSADLARSLGALVVHCRQRGYGAACHAGLSASTADFVSFCDCDASLDPSDVLLLLARASGHRQLIVGRRRPTHRRAWPAHLRLANRELARRVRRRCGAAITDVGPMRLARRVDLNALGLIDRRAGYPVETIVRAADAGWRITEVDVDYRPRTGTSKVTGTVRGSLQAVRDASAALDR
ncbi:MAG: glycosyltransferase family 2 protein [Actinomycetota bacterium]|nr:glycosyltransferase family 2 protein [Actinomycetota bacterium]